jgi:hypothetical protein
MPAVVAKMKEIGEYIVSHAPSTRPPQEPAHADTVRMKSDEPTTAASKAPMTPGARVMADLNAAIAAGHTQPRGGNDFMRNP